MARISDEETRAALSEKFIFEELAEGRDERDEPCEASGQRVSGG